MKNPVVAGVVSPEQLARKYEKLRLIFEGARRISSQSALDLVMREIVNETSRALEAERSSVFLYDRENNELWSLIAEGLDTEVIRFSAGYGLAGHVARTGQTLNIPDAYQDERFYQEIDRQTGFHTRSVLAAPLQDAHGQVMGVLQVLNRRDGRPFDQEDEELLDVLCRQAAVFLENSQLHERISNLFESFVAASTRAIEDRDPTTSGHSRRVTKYALNLARAVHKQTRGPFAEVRYTRAGFRRLQYAGLLHDFGKIGVREAILRKEKKLDGAAFEVVLQRLEQAKNDQLARLWEACARGQTPLPAAEARAKEITAEFAEIALFLGARNNPGPLTEEQLAGLCALHRRGLLDAHELECLSVRRGNLTDAEWQDMCSHVTITYQFLRKIPWLEEIKELAQIAYCHHEKPAGDGYPQGLAGADIPLDSRILAVADVYDALTAQDRPYKPAIPHERAVEIMRQEGEKGGLERQLVELFISAECWRISQTTLGTSAYAKLGAPLEETADGPRP